MNKMKLYRQYKNLEQYPMKRSEKTLSFTFVNFAKNKHIFGIEAGGKDYDEIHNIINFSICDQVILTNRELLAIIKKCHQRNGHISSISFVDGITFKKNHTDLYEKQEQIVREISLDGYTKERFHSLRDVLYEIEEVAQIQKISVVYGSCYFEFAPNGFVSYVPTQMKQLDTLLQEIF